MPNTDLTYTNGEPRDGFAASDVEPWAPPKPDVDASLIKAVALDPNAKELVADHAGHVFDAAADGIPASYALEDTAWKCAGAEERRLYRSDRARDKEPEIRSITTSESFGKPDGGTVFSRWLSVAMGTTMLVPIPLVVSLGIAESYVFEAVSDDLRFGLPFGLPVLGGIVASGLLRHTLSHGARDLYDRVVSVGSIVALAAWSGAYAYTFLAPVDLTGGNIAAELGFTDSRIYYLAHLGLEVTAGMGLAALAERGFAAGRKVVSIANETLDLLTDRADVVVERWRAWTHEAELHKDRRKRLTAARAAYVAECLGYLTKVQARRRAAVARAEAGLDDTSTET